MGIWWDSGRSLTHHQTKQMLVKANRVSAIVGTLARSVNYPITVLRRMWLAYAIPTIMYGMEVIPQITGTMDSIDTTLRTLMKSVLRLPQSTANAGIYHTVGLEPVKYHVWRAKMNYFSYLLMCDKERWVTKALQEQLGWLDGLLCQLGDNDPDELTIHTPTKAKYWLQEVANIYHNVGFPSLTCKSKLSVRQSVLRCYWDYLLQEIGNHNTLVHIADVPLDQTDHDYHRIWNTWWLKAKLGTLFLNGKRRPIKLDNDVEDHSRRKCPMCETEVETLVHFLLECPDYTTYAPLPMAIALLPWWFRVERSMAERKAVDRFIASRWNGRIQKMEANCIG